MKRITFCLVLVTLVLSIVSVAFMSEEKLVWDENWPTIIHIGTGSLGGGFYMGGSSVANVLKEEFPHLEVVVEQTKAAVHNLRLIEANEVEFAMSTSDTAFEAWNGQGTFEGEVLKGMRQVMPTWACPQVFATLKRSGITNVKEFKGKFSATAIGSATNAYVRKVFSALDIEENVDFMNMNITDTTLALKNGIVSGYSIGHPNTATQDLSFSVDTYLFGLDGEDAEKFLKLHPEYTYPLTIPSGSYKGQDEPKTCVGFYCTLIARDDLPEDMVYAVIKAMYKHQDIVKDTWPSFAEGMSPDFINNLPTLLHKGSIKYYREVGAEIPEELILDE